MSSSPEYWAQNFVCSVWSDNYFIYIFSYESVLHIYGRSVALPSVYHINSFKEDISIYPQVDHVKLNVYGQHNKTVRSDLNIRLNEKKT